MKKKLLLNFSLLALSIFSTITVCCERGDPESGAAGAGTGAGAPTLERTNLDNMD